jgi:hypothetical protein
VFVSDDEVAYCRMILMDFDLPPSRVAVSKDAEGFFVCVSVMALHAFCTGQLLVPKNYYEYVPRAETLTIELGVSYDGFHSTQEMLDAFKRDIGFDPTPGKDDVENPDAWRLQQCHVVINSAKVLAVPADPTKPITYDGWDSNNASTKTICIADSERDTNGVMATGWMFEALMRRECLNRSWVGECVVSEKESVRIAIRSFLIAVAAVADRVNYMIHAERMVDEGIKRFLDRKPDSDRDDANVGHGWMNQFHRLSKENDPEAYYHERMRTMYNIKVLPPAAKRYIERVRKYIDGKGFHPVCAHNAKLGKRELEKIALYCGEYDSHALNEV